MTAKPTVEDLGIDVDAQTWMTSAGPGGAIEVAFASTGPASTELASTELASTELASTGPAGAGEWVLMRVAGDPAQRVLVYDRFEWDCFLDGVKNGEFDDAAELLANSLK